MRGSHRAEGDWAVVGGGGGDVGDVGVGHLSATISGASTPVWDSRFDVSWRLFWMYLGAGYAAKFLVVSGVAMNMKILAYAAPLFAAPVACLAALFAAAASMGNDLEGAQWLKKILFLDSVRMTFR